MTDDDSPYTISIDSFNNKGYKGDDDFITWMKTEAPFVPSVSTDDITSSTYTITQSTLDYAEQKNWQQKLAYSLPIDLLHTLYPREMKEDENDDLPF